MSIYVKNKIDRKTHDITLEVLTPMFLGGAHQDAEIRPGAIKSIIRYWWRVAMGNIPLEELHHQEKKLWGGVHNGNACRSLVELAMQADIKAITLDSMLGKKTTKHPEAPTHPLSLIGYLAGMGHFNYKKGFLKKAFVPGNTLKLTISYPAEYHEIMEKTLYLFNKFGALGARSRNGFGSFATDSFNDTCHIKSDDIGSILGRQKQPYPHTLGHDDRGLLLWKSAKGFDNYKEAMEYLGQIYLDLRVSKHFKYEQKVGNRHLLGYPIMHHDVKSWGGPGGRMPSQLHWTIRKNNDKKLNIQVLHLPHALDKERQWFAELEPVEKIWGYVYDFLDNNGTLLRTTL